MTDRFTDNFQWVIKQFESDVRDGHEAEATMMSYIDKHGVGYALEWAASHVINSTNGRVATVTVLPELRACQSIEDVEAVLKTLEEQARRETNYISLGNNQMYVTGKIAMCQSLGRASDRIRAFVNFMRKDG